MTNNIIILLLGIFSLLTLQMKGVLSVLTLNFMEQAGLFATFFERSMRKIGGLAVYCSMRCKWYSLLKSLIERWFMLIIFILEWYMSMIVLAHPATKRIGHNIRTSFGIYEVSPCAAHFTSRRQALYNLDRRRRFSTSLYHHTNKSLALIIPATRRGFSYTSLLHNNSLDPSFQENIITNDMNKFDKESPIFSDYTILRSLNLDPASINFHKNICNNKLVKSWSYHNLDFYDVE